MRVAFDLSSASGKGSCQPIYCGRCGRYLTAWTPKQFAERTADPDRTFFCPSCGAVRPTLKKGSR